MDDVRYFFAVIVTAFVPAAFVWWCIVHPFVSFWRRVGPTRTLWTVGVLATTLVLGLIYIRDSLVLTDFGSHPMLLIAAAAPFSLSVWIRLERSRFLTMDILIGKPELEESGHGGQLLTEGIYGRIRHPRYVEIAAGTLAYAIFSNYLGAYLAAFAFFPLLHLIVLIEERELRARFGEQHAAYCEHVPRYIPRRI